MLQDIRGFKRPEVSKLADVGAAVRHANDVLGAPVPARLLTDYELSPDGIERMAKLRRSNVDRAMNVLQAWALVQNILPELLTCAPQDVLEFSTVHGALLEVLRHHGHSIMGTDYAPSVWSSDRALIGDGHLQTNEQRPDWPYRHVIDSVDVPMTLFDVSATPHPFKEDTFDYVICNQSIAHYAHPEDWMDLIAEFCRVSRRVVVVMLSPLTPNWQADPEYRSAFDRFRSQMAQFNQWGFACTTTFTEQGEVLGFKLTAA